MSLIVNCLCKKIIPLLFLLGSVLVILKLAFLFDAPMRSFILQAEGAGWDHSPAKLFFSFVSRYGDWPELMLLGVLGIYIAKRYRCARWQRIFLIAMIASTLAGAVTNTLRLTTGRTRPRVSPALEQAWHGPYYQGKWTVGRSEFNSFPSGHTATAFGFAIIIFLASPIWGLVALLLAALISLSRLLLGAHHPSDLIAAMMISLSVAWFLWNGINKRFPQRIDHAADKSSLNS
ncbi:MAG: phosphatase PAP2 family protein [Chthoniobacterales bacterium]|nr:phosphatase PAP2 family protein [Chthoniobacterales bacterium]